MDMKTKKKENNLFLEIDSNKIIHEMKGGIGASWHSMSKDIPLENEKYDYPARMVNPRGSSFGGNHPVDDLEAWRQIYHHAKWLGLNFIRVELSQRMYEPERKKFDWDNDEMKALYKILDWCQSNHADVFLQQMCGYVEWNSYPGVHPLISAPRSLDDFADGIDRLLRHLTKKRKYSCIKYFCITNEPPGGTWGYWWSYGSGSGSVTAALQKVRETLDRHKIKIPIAGPDWTTLPPFDENKIDFDKYIGAYDIHSYFGIDKEGEKRLRDWVNWAARKKKPFFITEFGNMNLGWGGNNPNPKSYATALSNTADVLLGINLGVDAFNRWSFTNRGDLDGQWQLIKTWDIKKKKYIKNIVPENTAYYSFAMLTRFIDKYSSVLATRTSKNSKPLRTAAVKSKDGNITVVLLNNVKSKISLNIQFLGIERSRKLNIYQITEKIISDKKFKLNPLGHTLELKTIQKIVLPPESITVLSTYRLLHEDYGIIE
jgi:hypothetical protein